MLEYTIIRSNRKTIAIQISPDGQIVVRCPRRLRAEEVGKFVASKEPWILKHISKLNSRVVVPFSKEEIKRLHSRANELVPDKVAYYASLMGVTYQHITIRAQKTRWGSCSSKGNLNFNCLLTLVPGDVLDYVVVHELCHLIEMSHSARFWGEVYRVLPNYVQSKRWLKENGSSLIARLP